MWQWYYSVSWSWQQIYISSHVIKLYRTKYTHTYINTSKTGEIWVRSVDYINVNILFVILYYYFTNYYHKANGTCSLFVLFLTIACEFIFTSVKISSKKILKKIQCTQYSVITYKEKESRKEWVCICITDSLCYIPETNTCKPAILQ